MSKEKIKKIITHWSASSQRTTVDMIRAWHKANGWRDVGYHRIILHPMSIDEISILKWSDLVKEGRPLDDDTWLEDWEKGAHTLYQNHDSVGVCVIGNPTYPLHPLQKEALINTWDILVERFKLTKYDVMGHRDFMATNCPGNEIYKLIKEYPKIVAEREAAMIASNRMKAMLNEKPKEEYKA